MLRTLRSGKYAFLMHAIPTFESPRPHSLSLGALSGRSLNKFLLSAHLLEIEIGRYIMIYSTAGTKVLSGLQAVNRPQCFLGWNSQPLSLCACIRATAASVQFYHYWICSCWKCFANNTTQYSVFFSSSHHYMCCPNQNKTWLGNRLPQSPLPYSNLYAANWTQKTASLTSGRNSWGINLWNRFPRQLRSISASIWEDTKETCQLPQLPLRFLMILTNKYFWAEVCHPVPVTFWAVLYHFLFHFNLCTISREMRRLVQRWAWRAQDLSAKSLEVNRQVTPGRLIRSTGAPLCFGGQFD